MAGVFMCGDCRIEVPRSQEASHLASEVHQERREFILRVIQCRNPDDFRDPVTGLL